MAQLCPVKLIKTDCINLIQHKEPVIHISNVNCWYDLTLSLINYQRKSELTHLICISLNM